MASNAKKAKALAQAEPTEVAQPEAAESKQKVLLAELATQPSVNAAVVIAEFGKLFGELDKLEMAKRLSDSVNDVWANDMRGPEAMLCSQAHALQAIFVNLSCRAATQEYLKQWEAYLRMALKAQNQCRMTLETLATIKNPPVVFARQANIAQGPQQVNNNIPAGMDSRARENETQQDKLSGGRQ